MSGLRIIKINIKSKINKILGIIYEALYFIIFGILGIALIASASMMVLSKTEKFMGWSREFILSKVNENLLGELKFSDFKIGMKDGFQFSDVVLTAAGDTVLYAKRITLDAEYFPLLDSKAIINKVSAENLRFKLLRSAKDSIWNVEKIAKPKDDTAKPEMPDWLISIVKGNITNGAVFVIDSTINPWQKFAPERLLLENFNLNFTSKVFLKELKFATEIRSMSFFERHSGIRLLDGALALDLDQKHFNIKKVYLKTDASTISANLLVDSINIFDEKMPENFHKAEISCSVDRSEISPSDLEKFTDLPVQLKGLFKVKFEAKGKPDNIKILQLKLSAYNSEFNISCYIKNALHPEKIQYNIECNKSKLIKKDLIEILPQLKSDELPEFGELLIKKMSVTGSVDSASFSTNLESELGKVDGVFNFGFNGDNPNYSGNFVIEKFIPEKIIKIPQLSGFVNLKAEFRGSGFDYKNMNASIALIAYDSKISNVDFKSANIKARIESNADIILDSLDILFTNEHESESNNSDEKSRLLANGRLSIGDMNNPVYNLNASYSALDLKKISGTSTAPNYLSGTTKIKGSGFILDSIRLDFSSRINSCVLGDRSMMPFGIEVKVQRGTGMTRSLLLNSDFVNASLVGNFSFDGLISLLNSQARNLTDFIRKRLKPVNQETDDGSDTTEIAQSNPALAFENCDANVNVEIRDVSVLGAFLDNITINNKTRLSAKIISGANESRLTIDSMIVDELNIKTKDLKLISEPIKLSGGYKIIIKDSIAKPENINFNLQSRGKILINDLSLSAISTKFNLSGNTANLLIDSKINNIIGVYTDGIIDFAQDSVTLLLDSTKVTYNKTYEWHSKRNSNKISYGRNGLAIYSLAFMRNHSESIAVSGRLKNNEAQNFNLCLNNFNLKTILPFIPEGQKSLFESLKGNIDSVNISVNGHLDSPDIITSFKGSNIGYNGVDLGSLNAQILHNNTRITGNIKLSNTKRPDLLQVAIASFPLDLSAKPQGERIHKRCPIDVHLSTKNLPLEIASPFAVAVKNLKGTADADLFLLCSSLEQPDYHGKINFYKTSFILEPTNLAYSAEGEVNIVKDKILLNNIKFENSGGSSRKGKGKVSGKITFTDLALDNIDIEVTADKLLVLSDESIKTMPTLYGEFIVSTGENPLHLYGSPTEPNLEGDINIITAHLNMPQLGGSQQIRTNMLYRKKGEPLIIKSEKGSGDSLTVSSGTITQPKNIKHQSQSKNIGELLNIDLNIKFIGQFFINIDLGTLSQFNAEIATKDKTSPVRFSKERTNPAAYLTGNELVVVKGSTIKIGKTLYPSGNIFFPTGQIDNPGLNLTAEYSGQIQQKSLTKNFTVLVYITGTKDKPNLKFSYILDNREVEGDSTQITQDALFLLLFNKMKADFFESGSGENLMSNVGSSLQSSGMNVLSSFASKYLTDVLGNSYFIKNAEISFQGTDAKLKLDGQLVGDLRWKASGNIADLANNNEFSIEVPLDVFLFQVTHTTNQTQTATIGKKDWEVKIKTGFSW
ncbi:MAG: hypothetical protein HW421_923 [Ignavibacteria bacterium]|nr:hypothetical protein [Ignavibacteria bacterium]